jgi:general secretion pathway protein I
MPASSSSAACSRARTVRGGARGFTLLEVLVALTIIAVALAAALRGAMSLTSNSRDVDLKLVAVIAAENRLLELRFAHAQIGPGESDFDCDEGTVALHCQESITQTPNPFFRRAEVHVDTVGDHPHRVADLMALLPAN